jgi:hypothetical protein
MPNLTPEKELLILAALQSKFQSVEGADNVLIENPLIDSKQDVVDLVTVPNIDDELEVKYIYLSFQGFEDSATDGCDDMPSVILKYNAHVVHCYKEKRSDASSSEQDIKALVLNLRNKFLNKNRTLTGVENSETAPLVQTNFIILDVDPLTGADAFFTDFLVKVEIT